MWYFLIRQSDLDMPQYQALQKMTQLTEVELFNEPHISWYIFTVEKDAHHSFVDHLDRQGIAYDLTTDRPTRSNLLSGT